MSHFLSRSNINRYIACSQIRIHNLCFENKLDDRKHAFESDFELARRPEGIS